MDKLHRVADLLRRMRALEQKLDRIDDRVSVLEERTIDHDLRLEDIEKQDDETNH